MLGIEFDTLTVGQLNEIIFNSAETGNRRIVANHNLHSIYLFHHDLEMRDFYRKSHIIHIDGMSLVYLARLLGYSVQRSQRVTYLDLIWPLMAESARQNWRVFYLGGKPGIAEDAAKGLRQLFPELELLTHHGYFARTDQENARILEMIRRFKPKILMVGMGMPLQEHWILKNLDQINAAVILPAGACFDYIAGVIPFPPRWVGKVGLEWLFRLASEPRRLWKRYLLEPWYIFGLVLKELFQ
jgi:N-acetylglucosaminyldiphosphoundecaprenol N-acetyl-beta-D-mannosaminyltransferase